ncbi:Rrf2 family transcriptional regulator [Sphingobacterium kyonggiense]|uniref:Rrf2 family transcriptional regulator n=1 Tax=Sphingobacterium kyonggiense TaxID=714075 RepID=A0ABP7Z1W7_9SPHI
MGMFSKSTEYAIRAVFYIAKSTQLGRKVGIKEIASNIESPEAFLGKILQELSKNGIIRSIKGPNGGFYLTEEEMNKKLIEVVKAIDGDNIFTGCGMGLQQCSEKYPCPLHNEFKAIRNDLTRMLNRITLSQFNDELILGNLNLNRFKVEE